MTTELFHPTTVREAVELLAHHGEDARPVAGGTALMLLLKQRLVQPTVLVALDRIPELSRIERFDSIVRLGATVRHRQVEQSAVVREVAPLVAKTYHHVATVRIRNQATVGGGLAHADPAQDPPAALIALDASVQVAGPGGARTVPIAEFFSDYYETVLRPGEIITSVDVPEAAPDEATVYLKFLPRTVDDYATVAVAARLGLAGDRLRNVRVALIAAGSTPIRAMAVEQALEGQTPDHDRLHAAAELVRDQVDPIDDVRGSAEYKRDMAVVFTRRAIESALNRLRGTQ